MEVDPGQFKDFAAGLVTESDLERILKIASCISRGDEAGFSSIPFVEYDESYEFFGGFRDFFGDIKIQGVRKITSEIWSLALTNFVHIRLHLGVEDWENFLYLNMLIDASTPHHKIIMQGFKI